MTAARIFELKLFLEEFQPDIMSIQEVKLNQEQSNLSLRFEGYSVHYKPRLVNPEYGGGVAIIIKDSIAASALAGLDDRLDNIGIRVETNDICFNLISLYAPAKTLDHDSVKNFFELGPETFILGDLNSKTPTVGCKTLDMNGKVLDDILSSDLDLCVLNDQTPTYFTFRNNNNYSEILDLMLSSTRLANKMSHFEVLTDSLMGSDHAPIMCILSLNPLEFQLKSMNLDLISAKLTGKNMGMLWML